MLVAEFREALCEPSCIWYQEWSGRVMLGSSVVLVHLCMCACVYTFVFILLLDKLKNSVSHALHARLMMKWEASKIIVFVLM